MRISDWSSDVCSSDLALGLLQVVGMLHPFGRAADQFRLAPSQYVGPGRTGRQPGAVPVGDQDGVARKRPEPGAVGPPLLFCQHALARLSADAPRAADAAQLGQAYGSGSKLQYG